MPYVDPDQQRAAVSSAIERMFGYFPGIGGARPIELADGEIGRTAWARVLSEFRQANAALRWLLTIERDYAIHAEPFSVAAKAGAVILPAAELLESEGRYRGREPATPPAGFFSEYERDTDVTREIFEAMHDMWRTHKVLVDALSKAAGIDPKVRHNLAAVIEQISTLHGTPLATYVAQLGGDPRQATADVASLVRTLPQATQAAQATPVVLS